MISVVSMVLEQREDRNKVGGLWSVLAGDQHSLRPALSVRFRAHSSLPRTGAAQTSLD